MALDPEQIAQLRQSAGLSTTPPVKGVNADDILAKRRANLGITEEAGSVVGDLKKSIPQIIKTRGAALEGNISGTNPDSQGEGAVVRGVQAVGNTFGAVTDIGGSLASSLYHHLVPQSIQENINKENNSEGTPVTRMFGRAYDELGTRLNEFAQQYPDAAKTLESLLKTGKSSGEIAGGILTAEGAKQTIEGATEAPQKIMDKADELRTKVIDKANEFKTPKMNDLEKINEKITPKPTVKEAKLAMDQGRLYAGSKGGVLKEGIPPKIAASEQQAQSVRTIHKNIPGAAEMDEPTLYQALDEKIGEIAKALKPEMEKVAIKPETFDKIREDWNVVKEAQKSPYIPRDVNVKGMQKAFQDVLDNVEDGTINDLWEARKGYDASIPSRIKEATDLSSETLQAQKDIWLENRRVLTDAINDVENGLGGTSRQAFSDMRDMYDAQHGLISKAKVTKTGESSKAAQFIKKHETALKIGGGIVGGAGALEIGRRVTGL